MSTIARSGRVGAIVVARQYAASASALIFSKIAGISAAFSLVSGNPRSFGGSIG